MEDGNRTGAHRLSLNNRANCGLTGVNDVESFDAELVVLATQQGRITIKGRDMHMVRLDLDKGEMDFTGRVDSLSYSDIKTPGTVSSNVFKRLFQ